MSGHSHLLEVCVDDPQGLAVAIAGGAQRIELCSALALGGLTPSLGLIVAAARAPVPVFAMIRPRPGGFVYDRDELAAAEVDISAVRTAGLAGIVFGATDASGRPDREALKRIRDCAHGLPMVMHRAIDVAPDLDEALDTAIEFGFCRVLTSGGAPGAAEGAEGISRLARRAAGRITIMAGGGVDADNAALLLRAGAQDLHGSCSEITDAGGATGGLRIASSRAQTSAAKVCALRTAMDQALEGVS
ncbi:MAG: copper homeostasis protein CutC [Paracoccus sp. (in: a-proteobacteria)]